MNVALTGSRGFIGSHLKTRLETAKTEIESELNISELKQDIFNEKKMEEFKKNHDQR